MRIAVAGQKSFGAAVVGTLVDRGEKVVAVAAPDANDRCAAAALRYRIKPTIRIDEPLVRDLGVDLLVCAHSHQFVSRKVRMALTYGAIGYHPSLLPRHRGRDAVRWTVAMRDPVAGGSVYWLDDNVDAGPVAAQRHVLVDPSWDHRALWRKRLFDLGLELISQTLDDLHNGVIVEDPQDDSVATWEPSWERQPLHRPDLIEIGPMPTGMRKEVRRGG